MLKRDLQIIIAQKFPNQNFLGDQLNGSKTQCFFLELRAVLLSPIIGDFIIEI